MEYDEDFTKAENFLRSKLNKSSVEVYQITQRITNGTALITYIDKENHRFDEVELSVLESQLCFGRLWWLLQ